MAPNMMKGTIMRYKITIKMEKMILDILILKQILENDRVSNREELEFNLNRLIDDFMDEFKKNNNSL